MLHVFFRRITWAALFGILICPFMGTLASAYSIEVLENTLVAKDFAVGPGKTEVALDPGQTVVRNITVTNRYGVDMEFILEIEDFGASENPSESLKLMGDEKGPYSLRDYLSPEIMEFKIKQGDRITIPVTINIPKDATPGGLYGSIIVSNKYDPDIPPEEVGKAKGGVNFLSRVASLFFVKVNGPVHEEGLLTSFLSDKKVYSQGPVNFSVEFENKGNIYTSPYGVIEIKNLYGVVVEQVSVKPFYVLPKAVRVQNFKWDRGFMMGRYTASLKLNRGYGNNIDERLVVFWVLPWRIVLSIVAGLFIVILIIRWISKNFEINRKGKNTSLPK